MSAGAPDVPIEDVVMDGRIRLEDLVDREGLDELCVSYRTLFGIPVRIYSNEGALLADATAEQELCAYVNSFADGSKACAAVVGAVIARDPGDLGDVVHLCFTGATYRIMAIVYDGRRVGRLIVGPFVPTSSSEPPPSLLALDRRISAEGARDSLARMPQAKPEMVTRIAAHLRGALDLILFSGHKAHVTSHLHLASVRENYRQLEEKTDRLQEAFDRLKELDRLKSNFLATVSHELRTPLTSIIGYSEMLAEGLVGDLQPDQREFVKTIQQKGEQLLSLIMGLLDLSKLENGTMRMTPCVMRIEAVLGEVVSTLAPAARKGGVQLALDLADGLAELRADPVRLRQVFLNLVDNAIKFTPNGGTVTMRARMVGDEEGRGDEDGLALLAPVRERLEVRVEDTGIGIPVRERAKVFDAFYQVDSSSTREHGGTGLGLSIVKRLVEAHAGTIRIEDNGSKGTTFVVSLPQSMPRASERSRLA